MRINAESFGKLADSSPLRLYIVPLLKRKHGRRADVGDIRQFAVREEAFLPNARSFSLSMRGISAPIVVTSAPFCSACLMRSLYQFWTLMYITVAKLVRICYDEDVR